MMRSLFSGVSGLRNHQTAMDVVGANIANVNTVGYRGSQSSFSDVISQTLQGASAATGTRGGTNPMQIGLGMGLASVSTIFTNGSYQSTGNQTDLAIQNDGFFIVQDGANQYYTRAGNFDFDSTGNYLVPGTGMQVMGWQADNNGAINTTGAVTSIQVPRGATMPSLASTRLVYANNLSGDALPGASAVSSLTVYDSLGNPQDLGQTFIKVGTNTWLAKASLANSSVAVTNALTEITFDTSGTNPTVRQATPTLVPTSTLTVPELKLDNASGSARTQYYTVFDASSTPHVVQMTFTQTSANNWTYKMTEAGVSNAATLLSGTVSWSAPAYTFTPALPQSFTIGTGAAQTSVSFAAPTTHTDPAAPGFLAGSNPTYNPSTTVNPVTFTPSGAAQSSITIDVNNLTQYGGASTVQAATQNGYAAGSLESTSIDTNGILVGRFSNGRTQNLGQVALATFNNPGGLTRIGDTLFASSNNSGNPSVGTSGTGGRGTLTPGSLEISNIDLADQFSKMIITQRGFQANSKIITTSDAMLEELVNLKR